MLCDVQSVSGAITIDEIHEDEDHDVVEKTQTEDFVSGITGCSRNVSPLASEFDDTTNVDEVYFVFCNAYDGHHRYWCFILYY